MFRELIYDWKYIAEIQSKLIQRGSIENAGQVCEQLTAAKQLLENSQDL